MSATNNTRDDAQSTTTDDTATTDSTASGTTIVSGASTDEFLNAITNDDGNIFDSWWEWESLADDPAWDNSGTSGEKRRDPITDPRDALDAPTADTQSLPSPDDNPREFLRIAAPDKLDELTEKFGDLPEVLDDQLAFHANRVADQHDADDLTPDSDDTGLVFTDTQEDTLDPFIGVDNPTDDEWTPSVMDDLNTDENTCPECGSTDISSYQQQTGGADEGMTSFNKCSDCEHSWRGGYGG